MVEANIEGKAANNRERVLISVKFIVIIIMFVLNVHALKIQFLNVCLKLCFYDCCGM